MRNGFVASLGCAAHGGRSSAPSEVLGQYEAAACVQGRYGLCARRRATALATLSAQIFFTSAAATGLTVLTAFPALPVMAQVPSPVVSKSAVPVGSGARISSFTPSRMPDGVPGRYRLRLTHTTFGDPTTHFRYVVGNGAINAAAWQPYQRNPEIVVSSVTALIVQDSAGTYLPVSLQVRTDNPNRGRPSHIAPAGSPPAAGNASGVMAEGLFLNSNVMTARVFVKYSGDVKK